MGDQPGLLNASVRYAWEALNTQARLRLCVLCTVLFLTLLTIALAAFGVTYALPKEPPQAYSPRLFVFLFLPAEFYVYDMILGGSPRATLREMYLDMRFARLLWAAFLFALMAVAACGAAALLTAAALVPFKAMNTAAFIALGLVVVIWLVLAVAATGVALRVLYLSVVVALRLRAPLRTLFGITKGKTWLITKLIFWPYLALFGVGLLMELVGPRLERSLGFVGLAPWFLADACLSGFLCCAGAALLALSYRRFAPRPGADEPASEPTNE